MGLLKTPEDEEIPEENDENNLNKDASPFKDLMATLEKPADLTGAKKKQYKKIIFRIFFLKIYFHFSLQLILELIQFLYFNITQTLLHLLVLLITIARKQLSSK